MFGHIYSDIQRYHGNVIVILSSLDVINQVKGEGTEHEKIFISCEPTQGYATVRDGKAESCLVSTRKSDAPSHNIICNVRESH